MVAHGWVRPAVPGTRLPDQPPTRQGRRSRGQRPCSPSGGGLPAPRWTQEKPSGERRSPVSEPLRRRPRPGMRWWRSPDGEPGPVLSACLAAAVLAPSVHNTQPWRFEVQPTAVEVYADYSRQLTVADPTGRELILSVGAAACTLRGAVRVHGRTPVQVLETRVDTGRLARISPGAAVRGSAAARALAWAIPRRRSNRWPFTGVVPGREVLDDLVAAAEAEGATLRFPGRDDRRAVLALVRTAEEELRDDPAY